MVMKIGKAIVMAIVLTIDLVFGTFDAKSEG
jgi:hypothetical protein